MDETNSTEPTNEEVIDSSGVVDPTQGQETTQEVQTPDYNNLYSDQLELTNHLISGQIFFMGLIFGVLLFKIFWDRWKI